MTKPNDVDRRRFYEGYAETQGAKEFYNFARSFFSGNERTQPIKKTIRKTHLDGAMNFLGLQIVRKMEDAGFPSIIHCCYRPPEVQAELKRKKRSKAGPWQSPHQYHEAVDIVHATLYWNASQKYWDTLAAATRAVASEFGVVLELGYDWGWDLAHIEIKDWRKLKGKYLDDNGKPRPLTEAERLVRFVELLPQVPMTRGEANAIKAIAPDLKVKVKPR